MQLPTYTGTASPLLTLAPEFIVTMWINPSTAGRTLLSKQSNSFTNHLSIYLDTFTPKTYIMLVQDDSTDLGQHQAIGNALTQDSWKNRSKSGINYLSFTA